MNMDSLLESYLKKLQNKSKSLQAILSPFIGIQVNLYRAIKVLKKEQDSASQMRKDFDAFIFNNLSDDMDKM